MDSTHRRFRIMIIDHCPDSLKLVSVRNKARPHPGPTAIELSAYGSKYALFETSLKMIRTIKRKFSSWDFAIRPNAHRTSQEKPLQFFNHLLSRNVAVQQRQQLILQRVEAHRPVDLLWIGMLQSLLLQGRCGRARQYRFQVTQ